MHVSLSELFENLGPGLLWVHADGRVHQANAEAALRTGLSAGQHLRDPGLLQAVAACLRDRAPRLAAMAQPGQGLAAAALACRVLPGLEADDAFVLISPTNRPTAEPEALLQVLRNELREPLREARASLALAEGRGDLGHEMIVLLDRVGELLQGLDRLLELSLLASGGAQPGHERVALWPLLQRAWGEVEPVALRRGVGLRFRTRNEEGARTTLHGSGIWLGRLLRECLEAAVRCAAPCSVVDVELRQRGWRAQLVFHQPSMFAWRDTASPVSAPKQLREQLGLALCRQVVAQHGGLLGDEVERGQRQFVVELPMAALSPGAVAAQADARAEAQALMSAVHLALGRSAGSGLSPGGCT